MPRLTVEKLRALLADRPSSAVIFLHGEEEYLRGLALADVVDAFVDASTRDFNYDQIRGSDATPEGLASLIATPPMMAEHRVIVVRDAQGLTPKAREVVQETLSRTPPGTILVLEATIPSSSKAKFYSVLKKEAASVEFPALDAMDLPGWLAERATTVHGVEMDMDAARALASAIGAQLGILATELEKAAAFVGDRPRITLEDIREVGGYIPQVDRWAWFDKVGGKRFQEALGELPALLDSGENGVGLVIGLTSHMLKLGLYAAGGTQGLERALRSNQKWLVRRIEPQARKWTLAEVDAALEDLLRADRLLKSAPLTDTQVIEEFLLRRMGEGAGAGASAPGSLAVR